jgi:hypothetical protein
MQSLRRRVERLEQRFPKSRPCNWLEFQIAAIEHWRAAELELVVIASNGLLEGRALRGDEAAILEKYDEDLLQHCMQAGFRSIEECARWYSKRSHLSPLRNTRDAPARIMKFRGAELRPPKVQKKCRLLR